MKKLTSVLVTALFFLIAIIYVLPYPNQDTQPQDVSALQAEQSTFIAQTNLNTTEASTTNDVSSIEVKNLINELKIEQTRLKACIKANELVMVPSDMTIRLSGSGPNGCTAQDISASHISNNTEEAYDYVKGFLDNYEETGSRYWLHNPDICIYDAEDLDDELEDRAEEYKYYSEICKNDQ